MPPSLYPALKFAAVFFHYKKSLQESWLHFSNISLSLSKSARMHEMLYLPSPDLQQWTHMRLHTSDPIRSQCKGVRAPSICLGRARHSTCWPANTERSPLYRAVIEADGCHSRALCWWRGQCGEADESPPSERRVKHQPPALCVSCEGEELSVCVCFCGMRGVGTARYITKNKQKERGCLSGAHGRAMTKRHGKRKKNIKTGQEWKGEACPVSRWGATQEKAIMRTC